MDPVCNQGLCGKKAAKGEAFCRAHRRLKSRSYPESLRVVFAPNPVSLALYTRPPAYGTKGKVIKMPLPGGRRTFLPGPGGGLLYVQWDVSHLGAICRAYVHGVSPSDCYRAED